MKYKFALDGKGIAVTAVGLCLSGALVFASGFLTGVGVHLPIAPRMEFMAKAPAAPAAKPLITEAKGTEAKATLPEPQPVTAPTSAAAPSVSLGATPAAAPVAASAPAPTAVPAALTTAPAAAVTNAAACGPAPETTPAAGAPGFALQLGSFLDAANASRLAATLKGRGCTATVYQITDDQNRTWTVVRIGPFTDLQDAVRAASAFKRQQGMLALVRPAGSL